MRAIQSGRGGEAARLAADIVARNPGQPKALHLFGYALLMQERAEEAIEPLEKAHRALRDPAIETQLAIALRKAGRTEDALKRLTRAVKRQPAFPAAIHEFAYLLYSLARNDEAIDVLRKGMDTAPRNPELAILLAWILREENDARGAQEAFARVLSIAFDHPDALYGMGLILFEAGNFNLAAERFQRAVAVNPSDRQSQVLLAACLLEQDQSGVASALLRQATRGGPRFYEQALKVISSSSRGRFWLKPSAAADFFSGRRS
jgi:tetratricopeptide (TPR) repeat protein